MTKRFHRILIYPLAASVPAVGMLVAAGTAAGASTGQAAQASGGSPSAHAAALARDAIRHLMIGQHATSENAGEARQITGETDVQSNNWGGWADTGSSVNKVSATWKEPTGACGLDVISMAAFWVGIDGLNSSSVEQDGTLIECYLGTEYQYTWWEMYPANSVQTVGSAVASGDTITASVERSGSKYALRVSDSTHPANSFSTAQTCASGCSNNSAEWVAEAPSGTVTEYPLTNFGTWKVSGASVTEGSKSGTISSFSDDKITMTGTLGTAKATPSGLGSGGRAFSVTWKSSE